MRGKPRHPTETAAESLAGGPLRAADILATVHEAVFSTDATSIIRSWNPGAERAYGYGASEVIGRHISLLYFDEDREQIGDRGPASPETLETHATAQRHRHRHENGGEVFVSLRTSTMRNADGEPLEVLYCSTDITVQTTTEETERRLQRELEHRVKNIAATIEAVMDQTIDSTRSLEGLRATARGRIGAITRLSTALAKERDRGVDLTRLVQLLVVSETTRSEAISLLGQPVTLPSAVARPLGMALHELKTNAAAYGALSVPTGRVSLEWKVLGNPPDRRLQLVWRERGGPAPLPPKRRGLGLELIEEAIPYEVAGHVSLTFEPVGVSCRFTVPLSSS